MIERDSFIESIEAWCEDSLATANDCLLGAFVTLRLLTCDFLMPLRRTSWKGKGSYIQGTESLLSLITDRVEAWENRWLKAVEADAIKTESCHAFLVRFYRAHLRLQLFSLPLQDTLFGEYTETSLNIGILWTAYSSAMNMLDLIVKYPTQLYFAQDSIHVMTAYSAAFLVKVRPRFLLWRVG